MAQVTCGLTQESAKPVDGEHFDAAVEVAAQLDHLVQRDGVFRGQREVAALTVRRMQNAVRIMRSYVLLTAGTLKSASRRSDWHIDKNRLLRAFVARLHTADHRQF